jgi:hypothetical protein
LEEDAAITSYFFNDAAIADSVGSGVPSTSFAVVIAVLSSAGLLFGWCVIREDREALRCRAAVAGRARSAHLSKPNDCQTCPLVVGVIGESCFRCLGACEGNSAQPQCCFIPEAPDVR